MKTQINFKIIFITLIILIILTFSLISLGNYYTKKLEKNTLNKEENKINYFKTEKTESKNIIKEKENNKITEKKAQILENTEKKDKINCKDMDCLITASKSCKQSELFHQSKMDIFNVQINTQVVLEIKGLLENNECHFYVKTEKIELNFPSELDQETIKQMKEKYKKLEGSYVNCKLETTYLTKILINWKNGIFSIEDLPNQKCKSNLTNYNL